MTFTWRSNEPLPEIRPERGHLLRAGLRALALVAVLMLGVIASLVLRLIERPVFGPYRPWTPFLAQGVSRAALAILGIRREVIGTPMIESGAVVANHVSWLDILALNASDRVYFVAKSEVAGWPGIGFLARITGAVFIARDRKQAHAQTTLLERRFQIGHRLLFFPEGSSTDGMRVLSFKSTLFQAFFRTDLRHRMHVQSVSLVYQAPKEADPRFYGWWGDMSLGAHLVQVLGDRRPGCVRIVWHPAVRVCDFADRKALAAQAEAQVRAGMPPDRRGR